MSALRASGRRAPLVGADAIDEIRATFGLRTADVGALFAVTRRAVQQWYSRGVPIMRAADVDRVLELSHVFKRKFRPARIPAIVRTPGAGLGGKSVLEVLAEHGVEPVYTYLERLFAYELK